jgi:hypothetical protein
LGQGDRGSAGQQGRQQGNLHKQKQQVRNRPKAPELVLPRKDGASFGETVRYNVGQGGSIPRK